MSREKYVKKNGYPTEHLIDRLSDAELLGHMGVPIKFVRHAIAMTDFPPDVEMWLENLPYIFRPSLEKQEEKDGLCGTGLLFYGPPSTRKTTTAAAVLLQAIRKKIPNTDPTGFNVTWHGAAMGRFVDWQEASESFRNANRDDGEAAAFAEEVRRAMHPSGPMERRADFLVIDDISRERGTDYNTGELQRIVRRRGDNGYPTIVTTNHMPEDWPDYHGEVLTAFLNRAFLPVEFS
jgi:DNA replication protein DnaC